MNYRSVFYCVLWCLVWTIDTFQVDKFSPEVEVRALIEGQFMAKRAHAEKLGYTMGTCSLLILSAVYPFCIIFWRGSGIPHVILIMSDLFLEFSLPQWSQSIPSIYLLMYVSTSLCYNWNISIS